MWSVDQRFSIIASKDIISENSELYQEIEARFKGKPLSCTLVAKGPKATLEKALKNMESLLIKNLRDTSRQLKDSQKVLKAKDIELK